MALTFGIDTAAGETPQTVAQRRQMANLIAARMLGTAPKNVGEGLNAIGQALIARSMMGEADDAQKAGMASLPGFLKSQITGQPVTSSPAPSVATPMGSTSIPAGNTEFVNTVMPLAQQASEKTGIDPRLITAQAALETGYGKSAPGNNLFGIKSHGQPGGNVLPTTEVVDGQPVRTSDSFMAYASPSDSANGYADFINKNPRYAPLKAAQGLEAQAAALGQSGYATDPNYGQKVLQIARSLPAPTGGVLADNTASPLDNAQYPVGPVGAPSTIAGAMQPVAPQAGAGAAPADTGAGSLASVPPPAQPAMAAQNRFLFKNASDEDIQKALINPFTPENVRAALTTESKLRADAAQKAADPLHQMQIQDARNKLTPIGQPYHDADGNLVQKDALGKVTVLSAADKTPTTVGEYNFYAKQESDAGRTPLPFGQWDIARRRSGATNVNTGTIPKGYEQIQDQITGAVSMRPIPGGPADTSKQDKVKSDAQTISGNVVINAAKQARDALNAAGLPAAGSGSAVLSTMGETNAAELRRQIDVLKANASIETLNQMRQQSKTGGALGSVTEGEERLLAAKSGAIDPSAPPAKVRAAIDDYERTLLETVHGKEAGDKIFEATRAQTPAQPQGSAEGAIAVNPQTGERIIRKGGKWVPFT